MKKLLALLLCVMLFVAVIPTSAFASSLSTGWADKAVSNTAIKEAEKSIKNMYTAIATDELVFGTAKSLHDLFDGLAKNLFDGVDTIDNYRIYDGRSILAVRFPYHDKLVDNTRAYLKGIVGDAIAKYISDRTDAFKSDSINGGVDPEKYLNVFVAAVNDAVGSEKAQKGLEAFVNNIFVIKSVDSLNDQLKDLNNEIIDWGTDKIGEFGNFGSNYKPIRPEVVLTNDTVTNVAAVVNNIGGQPQLGMPLGEWP